MGTMDINARELAEARGYEFAFDIETADKDDLYTGPRDGSFVRLVGTMGSSSNAWIHGDPARLNGAVNDLQHWNTRVVYGANVFRFDIAALARHAGADYDTLAAKAVDLSITERLIHPPGAKGSTKPGHYGLDEMAKRYGHTGKSDDLKALAAKHGKAAGLKGTEAVKKGFSLIPTDDPEYVDYLRGDLEATQFVYNTEAHRKMRATPYHQREMKVAAIQGRMTFNGWRVDVELLQIRAAHEEERRSEAAQVLGDEYGVPLVKADGSPALSPWSTKQGREALEAAFKAAGAPFVPRTKTGALATGRDAMSDGYWIDHEKKRRPGMRKVYGHIPRVVELCETLTVATGSTAKYAEILKYVTGEGRVHGRMGEDQASGRWAMVGPSLTNLGKRDEKVEQRAPFLADEGHVLITCDLSQVDMRAVAALSQDPGYMALFEPGRDAHEDMAEVYFGGRTKELRQRTKAINHKVNYGGSAATTAEMNNLPLELVQDVLRKRAEAYPRLIEWTQEARAAGEAGRLLDNGFGRMMRCDPQRAYTQAPALLGQGCARDIMCESLLRLVKYYPQVTPFLRGVVHDEVILSVPADEAEFWTENLEWAFTWEWRGVPILCEVSKPGRNWEECCD